MRLFYSFIFLLSFAFLNAQIVTIPDANFKNALIDEGVDTNSDGEIQVSEAEVITNLTISFKDISSLEGIQSFINIEVLHCSQNQLTSLDMSQNTNLEWLTCGGNQLTYLNVTQNPNLINLWCGNNQLSSLNVIQNLNLESLWCWDNLLSNLDISENTNLRSLGIGNNLISSLDVTQNVHLEALECESNPLTSLDVRQNLILESLICYNNQLTSLFINNGNNHNMHTMISTGNTGLTCIQVDNESATYPDCGTGIPIDGWCKDTWSSYSELCQLGMVDLVSTSFMLYPNPASEVITISSRANEILIIHIYTVEGKKVRSFENINQKVREINLKNFNQGIYFLKIYSTAGTTTKKIIKK